MIQEITIKGQKALELDGGKAHYVEIENEWFSVNGNHFEKHLGGIRWQVDLEYPIGDDKELVEYLRAQLYK